MVRIIGHVCKFLNLDFSVYNLDVLSIYVYIYTLVLIFNSVLRIFFLSFLVFINYIVITFSKALKGIITDICYMLLSAGKYFYM